MTITPKNWSAFQHYKTRRPPWIKLHHDLIDNYDFHRLPVASKALAPCLWLLASEYEGGQITASLDEIAFRLHMTKDDLVAALKPLIEAGFFQSDSVALATRKQHHPLETETETETETEVANATRLTAKPSTRDRVAGALVAGAVFERFWKLYPQRDGSNPKEPAKKKFLTAVKSGVDPDAIVRGVEHYAAELRMSGKIGSVYVAQAKTWLNQKRWTDYQSPPKPPEKPHDPNSALAAIDRVFERIEGQRGDGQDLLETPVRGLPA